MSNIGNRTRLRTTSSPVNTTVIRYCGICCSPHLTGKCGTRPSLGGSVRRAVAHTRPAFPKIPSAPSAFPLLGAPQAPGDQPNPPEGGKSLGEGPLRPEEISRCRDTLGWIRAAVNTADRSATRQLKRCSIGILRYLLCDRNLQRITFQKISELGQVLGYFLGHSQEIGRKDNTFRQL